MSNRWFLRLEGRSWQLTFTPGARWRLIRNDPGTQPPWRYDHVGPFALLRFVR